MRGFGTYIRTRRETLAENSKDFSLRKISKVIGVEPAFLSKVEREVVAPPSEAKIVLLSLRSKNRIIGGSTWRGSRCAAGDGR